MGHFVDETRLLVKAGDGGPGCVSFLHEKYKEFGGPDGGDGGDGGNVFLVADPQILSLSHIRPNKVYRAENGKPGKGQKRAGKKGRDLFLKVPIGTQLFTSDKKSLLHDFTNTEPFLLAKGGQGGKGNAFFATATRQNPRFAQRGEKTEVQEYFLALKLIADVGLVGFPNAGKSTLLRALTSANPKIAPYAFTTLSPNLGILENETLSITIADIPGILEGASKGYGLGISFLKHMERVRLLIFVLDISQGQGEAEFSILREELAQYSSNLLDYPFFVVFNKIDLIPDKKFLKEYLKSFPKKWGKIFAVSAETKQGILELKRAIFQYFTRLEKNPFK